MGGGGIDEAFARFLFMNTAVRAILASRTGRARRFPNGADPQFRDSNLGKPAWAIVAEPVLVHRAACAECRGNNKISLKSRGLFRPDRGPHRGIGRRILQHR